MSQKSTIFSEKSFDLSWRVMSIVLLPILVVTAQQLILLYFSQKGVPVENTNMKAHVALEAAKRLHLLSISYLYFSVCALVSAKIIYDLLMLSSKNGRKKLGAGLLLLLCVSSVVGAISIFCDCYLNISIIGEGWFRLALDGTLDCSTKDRSLVSHNWGYARFLTLLDVSAVITVFTIPFLIVGAISCLDKVSDLDALENWKFQTHRFKHYMFACSAVLILGVLFFKAWTSYPSVLLADKDDLSIRLGLEALSNSMTMLTGLTYTFVFASFSLPVGYILNRRANVLTANAMGSKRYGPEIFETVVELRKSKGLTLTTMELVQSVFALVAPLLTGAFSSLLGSLS